MFLVNSRSSLVTETSHHRGWHPFFRSYGANLPNSLAWINADTPWASHPGAPVSVLGTDARTGLDTLFTGTRDPLKIAPTRAFTHFSPLRLSAGFGA